MRRIGFPKKSETEVTLESLSFSQHFSYVESSGHPFSSAPGDPFLPATAALQSRRGSTPIPRRLDLEANQLHCDLMLCGTTLASDPIQPATTPAAPDTSHGNLDDLFAAAAGQLSLEDKHSTAAVHFSVLQPKIPCPQRGGSDSRSLLDLTAALPLLAEWPLGQHADDYQWDGPLTRLPSTPQVSTGFDRPIRPLPSLRPHPTQPAASTHSINVPPVGRAPTLRPLPHTSTFPAIQPWSPTRPGARSSPPPAPTLESLSGEFPHTQVERGLFGARPEVSSKTRKKAAKKRAGGF